MFWRPKTPGKFMLRLRVPNGVLTFNQLEVIADIISNVIIPSWEGFSFEVGGSHF